MKIQWKYIIRDIAILYVLTGLAGFLVGFASSGNINMLAVGLGNVVFSIVGFTLSGCFTKSNRLAHMLQVAVIYWILNFHNVLFNFVTITQWLISSVVIVLTMFTGFGISSVFVKEKKQSVEEPQNDEPAI